MKKITIIIGLFIIWRFSISQNLSNFREKQIVITDSLKIDSLSIVPASIIIRNNKGQTISPSKYKINCSKSILTLVNKELEPQNLKISYRVFDIDFSANNPVYTPKLSNVNSISEMSPFYMAKKTKQETPTSRLAVTGNILRGVSVSNNQNMAVNSNLNLQLDGYLNDDMQIKAVMSDRNIPIQPDGFSQKIQEFDQIYIRLFDSTKYLQMGDVDIASSNSYFLKFNRKIKGGDFTNNFTSKKNDYKNYTQVSAAIAKGNFNRQKINGIEGVQGPYRLLGANNEIYIMVLAGSEKVYVDGLEMERGENADYVMNYNTSELTFTTKNMISKDSRIIVEFEYSDRNYNRFLAYAQNKFSNKKASFTIQLFAEGDAKNQAINQDLSDEQKQTLANAGNDPLKAITKNYDTVTFDNNMILYEMVDTIADNLTYDSIFVQSFNPEKAFYQVGFALVGKEKGNYILSKSAANGKVYQWIAPINGAPQGNYEPIKLLIPPKKQQMLVLGASYLINKNTKAGVEVALSNHDLNTYSKIDNEGNQGIAIKSTVKHDIALDNSRITLFGDYHLVHKNFNAIERFRNTEFNRDWNITVSKPQNEHLIETGFLITKRKSELLKFKTQYLNRKTNYQGFRNNISTNLPFRKNRFISQISLLNSKQKDINTQFYRHNITLKRKLRLFDIGVRSESEFNKQQLEKTDSLLSISKKYVLSEAFIQMPDSAKRSFAIVYKNRADFSPFDNSFNKSMETNELSVLGKLASNKNNKLYTSMAWRKLKISKQKLNPNLKDENNLMGRIEHRLKIKKQLLSFYTFYETSTGMETKKEFSYIEVGTGQGIYVWIDYNKNKIQELNEFEVSPFPEEANYIRIYTPTNDYIKVYTTKLNSTININPSRLWANKKGLAGFASRFSDVFSYRIQKKHTNKDLINRLNPFMENMSDTVIINTNSSLRNKLTFNRLSTKFSTNWTYSNSNQKNLLVSGYDNSSLINNQIKTRWNITYEIVLLNEYSKYNKTYKSEYFTAKNYKISAQANESTIQWQPNTQFRMSIFYRICEKENLWGDEKATIQKLGPEFKLSAPNKGFITLKVTAINASYNSDKKLNIAYEMLQGFLPGENYQWSISVSRNLNKYLRLNINYNGRKSPNSPTINTGQLSLNAFF